jgi:hypothetical protein
MSDLTLKSAKSLYCNLGETIQMLERSTDEFMKAIKLFETLVPGDSMWKNFYSANVQMNLIYLDFCAAYRLYLIGTTNYEQRFAMKNIYVITKEGYKRIYGFTEQIRNKSLWRQLLLPISAKYNDILGHEAEVVNNYLLNFKDELITGSGSQNSRNLAVHYSEDCRETYEFLKSIDAEVITNGANHFMELMTTLRKYCFEVNRAIKSKQILINQQ